MYKIYNKFKTLGDENASLYEDKGQADRELFRRREEMQSFIIENSFLCNIISKFHKEEFLKKATCDNESNCWEISFDYLEESQFNMAWDIARKAIVACVI